MVRQMDFRWRYQPRKTVDVQLMKYIQSNLMMGKTQMMLVAVRSFWLTHAIANDLNDEKLKNIYSYSGYTTKNQSDYYIIDKYLPSNLLFSTKPYIKKRYKENFTDKESDLKIDIESIITYINTYKLLQFVLNKNKLYFKNDNDDIPSHYIKCIDSSFQPIDIVLIKFIE